MNTTKISGGMAFNPTKELQTFSRMAAQGKRLCGVGALGHGWTFTEAPPEQAIFDVAYEKNPTSDYFELFTAAGWTPVLSSGDMHIFKAATGTPPVHTAAESQRDELVGQRNMFARFAAITFAALALVGLLLRAVSWNEWVEMALLTIALIPVVYTVMPLCGYMARLRKFD